MVCNRVVYFLAQALMKVGKDMNQEIPKAAYNADLTGEKYSL